MAAGLGFKDFTTGEVLTAADVDGYLMQGVWVFADAAARTAAVTSPQEGNISFLKDTNSTEYYSGSAWVAIGGSVPTSYGLSAGKNIVINGGFDIWQRGTSGTANSSNAGAGYNADRWQNRFETGALTVSRQATSDTTNLPNIQYCARVQRNSGNTVTNPIYHVQTIETSNTIPRVGQTVILSFYARKGANFSATSNTLTAILDGGTGTDQNIFGFTGYASLISSAVTLTSTWQRFTATATVTSTLTELGVGFSYTPVGTAGANDYFEVTGVQLELGTSATAFQTATGTIQGELAACQRYYYRAQATANYTRWGIGQCTSSTAAAGFVSFPITMRTSPTALEQTGTASNYGLTTSTGSVNALSTVPTFDSASPDGSTVVFTVSSGLTAGNATQLLPNGTTAPYLGWSAEL
jgi:hypothetical protein